MPERTGYFIFSLDTELGWGHFDLDQIRARLFSPGGDRERESIRRILALCSEYGIIGTWAIVGHLFYEHCEDCPVCPVKAWKGKYRSFEEAFGTADPLWYGADIVEMITSQGRQEIAFHGYTHAIFDAATMSKDDARVEIEEWKRVAHRAGIEAKAVVFPRNRVAYLDMLYEAGFTCYRSEPFYPWLLRTRYFNIGSILRAVDHLLAVTRLPLYDVPPGAHLMVNVGASQHLFDFHPQIEKLFDKVNLHRLRLRRIRDGIHEAARQKKMLHIWAHPWEFRTGQDFDKLRYVFEHVADEVERGQMRSIGMADFAALTRETE
ncbi:MAG: polysaccharide deacetylase family protein [Anaerolineae bacterium]|nr:polysaccharide deacetylase family protein [Anaerolineae bacterium]